MNVTRKLSGNYTWVHSATGTSYVCPYRPTCIRRIKEHLTITQLLKTPHNLFCGKLPYTHKL